MSSVGRNRLPAIAKAWLLPAASHDGDAMMLRDHGVPATDTVSAIARPVHHLEP
ncbi:hypothetical protein [Rhodococcus jostii]|uniref:Uncharacterized protein n=1 Tax=Rhodococcus jostii TaxID=132919 RepID=A0ABU4CN40_RHOJO|nr:hypothetical protein [Rhodococcus jostii]MDV6284991.1 hypothetical protein [Rhodococcus jostii]